MVVAARGPGSADGVKLDAHVHEPLDGVAGLEVVGTNETGVDLVMGKEHVATEQLAGGDLDHGCLLDGGTRSGGAHAHIGGTAGVGGLLEGDDAGARLGGCDGRGQTGQAGCDDDYVGFELLHIFSFTLGPNAPPIELRYL